MGCLPFRSGAYFVVMVMRKPGSLATQLPVVRSQTPPGVFRSVARASNLSTSSSDSQPSVSFIMPPMRPAPLACCVHCMRALVSASSGCSSYSALAFSGQGVDEGEQQPGAG